MNNAYTLSAVNTVGDRVKYTCHSGYLFPDLTKDQTIECMPNRQWSRRLPDCVGEL